MREISLHCCGFFPIAIPVAARFHIGLHGAEFAKITIPKTERLVQPADLTAPRPACNALRSRRPASATAKRCCFLFLVSVFGGVLEKIRRIELANVRILPTHRASAPVNVHHNLCMMK